MFDALAAQLQGQIGAYQNAEAQANKAVEDIKKYKGELQNQYNAELGTLNNVKSDFITYAKNYQESKKNFELDAANAQQLKSGQSVQAVTVEKTNKIPFVILAGVLGYLYWKGKIKI